MLLEKVVSDAFFSHRLHCNRHPAQRHVCSSSLSLGYGLCGCTGCAQFTSLHLVLRQLKQVLQPRPRSTHGGLVQSVHSTLRIAKWCITLFEKHSRLLVSLQTLQLMEQLPQRHCSKSSFDLGYFTPGPGRSGLNWHVTLPGQVNDRQFLHVVHPVAVHGGFVQFWHT